jgi:hypothetical protein
MLQDQELLVVLDDTPTTAPPVPFGKPTEASAKPAGPAATSVAASDRLVADAKKDGRLLVTGPPVSMPPRGALRIC